MLRGLRVISRAFAKTVRKYHLVMVSVVFFIAIGCAANLGVIATTSAQGIAAPTVGRPEGENEKGCGQIGHLTIQYEKKNLFFPVAYEGINQWRGDAPVVEPKGCKAKISSIVFPVDWPTLAPSTTATYYTSEDPKYISFVIKQGYVADHAAAMEGSLLLRLGGDSTALPSKDTYSEVKKSAVHLPILDMYARDVNTSSENVKRTVYWSEDAEGKVWAFIDCRQFFKPKTSSCDQVVPNPKRGIWIFSQYRIERLSEWKVINESSLSFIDNITISGKVR